MHTYAYPDAINIDKCPLVCTQVIIQVSSTLTNVPLIATGADSGFINFDQCPLVCIQVLIQVLDINDNCPEFSQELYEVDLSENTPAGVDVLTLHATDRDEDKRLFYTILSATNQASLDKFKINSETGILHPQG